MLKSTYCKDTSPVRVTPRLVGADGRPVERRALPRDLQLPLLVEVHAPGVALPVQCTLRDLSSAGARLEIERQRFGTPASSSALPGLITIILCRENSEWTARIIWRDGRHFGVAFLGAARRPFRGP